MKKNKSNFKAVYIFILGFALFIFGGYWLTQHTTIFAEKIPGDSESIKEFNKIVKGDVSSIEIGTVFNIPEEVRDVLRVKANNLLKNMDPTKEFFSYVPTEQIRTKYKDNFKLEDIVWGNLKPKYLKDFSGAMYLFHQTNEMNPDFEDSFKNFCFTYISMGDSSQIIDQNLLLESFANEEGEYIVKSLHDLYIKNNDNYYDILHDNVSLLSWKVFRSYPPSYNVKYNNKVEKFKFGPEQFNDASNIAEHSIVSFIPTSVEKISDNQILIHIELSGPVTSGYIHQLKNFIGEKWVQQNREGYNVDKNHVFIKIYDKDILIENFGGYGVTCADTPEFTRSSYDGFRWYPNEAGIEIIKDYFARVNVLRDNDELINPNKIFSEMAKERNLDYFEVSNCVLSYIYMSIYQ